MKEYEVEITEYLQRTVKTLAESSEEAINRIKDDYDNCKIILGEEDFIQKEIEIYNPNKFISKLDLLLTRIDEFNKARDWNKFHTPSNLAKSISIEANELLECFQWDDKNYNVEDVKEELADVLNYCLQMAMVLGLDPIEIINKKMDKTENKYPVDKAKGVSTKYNKL